MEQNDFIGITIQSVLDKIVHEWRQEGLTSAQIIDRIEKLDIPEACETVVSKAGTDYFDSYKTHMFEIAMEARADADGFLSRQEQKWGKCFAASITMYQMAIEIARIYSRFIEQSKETKEAKEKQFTLFTMQLIHGRVCQEYLEIYYLLRYGFADGAFARWRSMYELCCCGQFILLYGERFAKQFYEQANTDLWRFQWTQGATDKDGKAIKINTFDDLQNIIEAKGAWREQYRVACSTNHGFSQGTFKRLGITKDFDDIPVGHSDYGIAMPAINASVTLAWASNLFLNSLPSFDSKAFILLMDKWLDYLREQYISTEEQLFPDIKPDDNDSLNPITE